MFLKIPFFIIAFSAQHYASAYEREGRTLGGMGLFQNLRGFFQRTPSSRTPDYIIPEAQLVPPKLDEVSSFYGYPEVSENVYSNRYIPNPRAFQFNTVSQPNPEVAYVPVANPIYRPEATIGYLAPSPTGWQYHEDNSYIPSVVNDERIDFIGHSEYGVPFTHSSTFNNMIQYITPEASSKVEPVFNNNVKGLEPPTNLESPNIFRNGIEISNTMLIAPQLPGQETTFTPTTRPTQLDSEEPSEIANRFSGASFTSSASDGTLYKTDGSYNIHIGDNTNISNINKEESNEIQPLPTEHIQIENGFAPIPAPSVKSTPIVISEEHHKYFGQALPHSQLFSDRYGSDSQSKENAETDSISLNDQETINKYTYATPSLSINPIIVLNNSEKQYQSNGAVEQPENEKTIDIVPIIDEPKETKKPSRGNKKYTRLHKYQK